MVAYVVVDVDIHDPVVFEEYRTLGVPTIELYGGRVLARSESAVPLEGDWEPKRLVLLQFESIDRAQDWHRSAEYEKAKRIRRRAATTNSIFVEGI